ncbi:patatin-like phospholipase family protein [Olivibacter sp. SDN3]|uniref:patatin-like phospholipase family protein n=1 Tax=Olivibacter sp. SDN3 TaxID=2764720 RepID=UPI00165143AC|nr:patatin-like phospholipase family protein [Olivibacter sp. SDN3]QNL48639.1 patatin-like phospholipase family protein [Olivibacter sp. SDN3]
MKKILSIDGGGIRGIIPGMILVALEEKLKNKTEDPHAAIVDFFDFFAGTSTGGILICLLLCPDQEDPKRPRFSAKEALDLYLKYGHDIFKMSFVKRVVSRLGLASERYNSDTLERVLLKYFGKCKLSELIKPCIISAYNIELRKTHFFRQQTAIERGDVRDFYLKDVCRATSAAPTYFSVAEIYSIAGTRYPLLDGGVFATNPALSGLVEVTKAFNQTKINDIHIFSLGTGRSRKSYNLEHFKKSRAMSMVPALIDIMMSGVAESSDFFLHQLFKSSNKDKDYLRIEPDNLHSIEESLDAANEANMKRLIALGDRTISENDAILNKMTDFLIEERKKNGSGSKPWSFLNRGNN